MEIFGGFMVMMSILGFFLAIIWLIMPFVVLTIKGKLDKTLDMLDSVNTRLSQMEAQLATLCNAQHGTAGGEAPTAPVQPATDDSCESRPLPLV